MSGAALLTLAALAALSTSCQSSYHRLRPEAEIPDLAALGSASDAMPSRVELVEVRGADAPCRIAVERRSAGRHGRRVGRARSWTVMIHGLLSDHRAWRFVAGDLGRDHDLLVVDLPGCGRSDKPDPAVVGDAFYAPEAMARAVAAALDELIARADRPPAVTLVGHSLGGMVALRILGDPALRREFPQLHRCIERAVLFAPADVAVEHQDAKFVDLAALTDAEVQLAAWFGLLAGHVTDAVLAGTTRPDDMPREEVDRLIDALRDPATRRPAQAMIRRAVPWRDDGRPDWDRIGRIERFYAEVCVPCLIVWGKRDETLPVAMGYKLAAQLPQACLRVVVDGMHALPSERPRQCAELIREFGRTDGIGWAAVREIDAGPAVAGAGGAVDAPAAAAVSAAVDASAETPTAAVALHHGGR